MQKLIPQTHIRTYVTKFSSGKSNLTQAEKIEIAHASEIKLTELVQKYKTPNINDPRIRAEMERFMQERVALLPKDQLQN